MFFNCHLLYNMYSWCVWGTMQIIVSWVFKSIYILPAKPIYLPQNSNLSLYDRLSNLDLLFLSSLRKSSDNNPVISLILSAPPLIPWWNPPVAQRGGCQYLSNAFCKIGISLSNLGLSIPWNFFSRAFLESCELEQVVQLDATDLVLGGWYDGFEHLEDIIQPNTRFYSVLIKSFSEIEALIKP